MQLPPPSRTVRHPETGDDTPVWTRRQAAGALDIDREALKRIEHQGLIPEPVYGSYRGSPLWSMRQITLIAGVLKWVRANRKEHDKFSYDQLRRQVVRCKKEWDDGKYQRNRDGNHRNARWRARRLFGIRRNLV